MKAHIIKHMLFQFQNLWNQEMSAVEFKGSLHINLAISQTARETNTSAFAYVLSVMLQNSSALGAEYSSYFLQKENLQYYQ
jgi:hypothetical protein